MRKSVPKKPKTTEKVQSPPSPRVSAKDAKSGSMKSASEQNREIHKLYAKLCHEETSKLYAVREGAASSSFPEVESGSTLDEVMRILRLFEIWHFSPSDPSVQKLILDGAPDCAQLYEANRRASRLLLFDIALGLVCGLGDPDSDHTLEEARGRTDLITNPNRIMSNEGADFLSARLNTSFLKDLTAQFYNAERRKDKSPTDMHMLVLTRHWVDPHCPLWMMTLQALENVLPKISTGGNWTHDGIRKRIKKLSAFGVTRFPKQPIIDIQFGGSGWMKIKEFTIAGEESPVDESELEYRVVFRKGRKKAD
jgi:hypothetical protein